MYEIPSKTFPFPSGDYDCFRFLFAIHDLFTVYCFSLSLSILFFPVMESARLPHFYTNKV